MAGIKLLGLGTCVAAIAAASLVAVAQTNSTSPFASQKPKAWEQQPAQAPQNAPQSQTQAPYQSQTYQQPYGQPSPSPYQNPPAPARQNPQLQYGGMTAPGTYRGQAPAAGYAPAQSGGQYQNQNQYQAPKSSHGQAYGNQYGQQPTPQNYPQYQQAPATQAQQSGAYYNRAQAAPKQSWAQRMGWGNVETSLEGHAKIGIAGNDRNGADPEFESAFDLDVRGEISAITEGGLEYGAGLRGRAQQDKFRRGFGGLVGDCPAADPLCASVNVAGDDRAIKGHTSQFYASGNPDVKDTQFALEGAYLFLRSGYGNVTIGRDDGAAYLFSLGAPSLVMVGASNSPVDYTGLDSVKTYNDPSGFSEKIRYTSPRMLGDSIGVGVQVGVSYALDAKACGVDYCVEDNTANALDPFAPDIEDVFEVGIALDRTFDNGFSAELTGTYARGSEASGLAAFDDLQTWGAGLELGYGDFVFGTSYLNSNNGLAGDGNYKAYDAGLTWQPSALGITLGYGHADDELTGLKSDQGVFALSYDIDNQYGKYRLGTGVQYIKRGVNVLDAGTVTRQDEDAIGLFVEAGVTF